MKMRQLEVLCAPIEQSTLSGQPLRNTVCVVFDILRATSSLITALSNGAESVLPVCEISEALAAKAEDPAALLAGERNGLLISRALTGGRDFDFGNSPAEFTRERVEGRRIIATTTNGTRALIACAGATRVFVGSFLNMRVTAQYVRALDFEQLILVCSGTGDESALEDVLAAGAFAELVWDLFDARKVSDAAQIARSIYLSAAHELEAVMGRAKNGKRLLDLPDVACDVARCARRDTSPVVAEMLGGRVKRVVAGCL